MDGEPKWKVWLTGSVTGTVQKSRAGMKGGRGEEGHRVVGGRDDGLEPKGGGGGGGGGVATGLGRKPVGGCDSAEMRRPATRSTAHENRIRRSGWFTGMCHEGTRLDQGDRIDMWGHAMGTQVTGWIGAMDWIMCVALAGTGDGIDSGGLPWGHTTLTGSGWWDWYVMGAYDWIGEMGLIWGGTPLGCDAGWDTSWGHDWIREMGLLCGLWNCGYGIDPWGVSNGKVLYGCWM